MPSKINIDGYSDRETKVIESWTKASSDLQIKIITPFSCLDSNNTMLIFPVLVPNFGSSHGTVIVLNFDQIIAEEIGKGGFGYSTLGPSYYNYSRSLFIETLEDWGFFGPQNLMPTWYTHRDF